MREPIIFTLNLAPGDTLVSSGAIYDLHQTYPNEYKTTFRGTASYLFENNPYIEQLTPEEEKNARCIKLGYPLVHKSNSIPYHFSQAFVFELERNLDRDIISVTLGGKVFLSDEEKYTPPAIPGDYWLIFAGGKYDFTAKWWNPDFYQDVVDHFRGKIRFVQVGAKDHFHPKLDGVIDMIGKTPKRELIRLIYHSVGVLTPVSFGMHLATAVPSSKMDHRACVVIAGGREPVQWEMYPWHQFLHSVGTMDCCAHGGCWKGRCQQVGDNDKKDFDNRLCKYPVDVALQKTKCEYSPLHIPKCMYDIKPADVIRAIEKWYNNGYLTYEN